VEGGGGGGEGDGGDGGGGDGAAEDEAGLRRLRARLPWLLQGLAEGDGGAAERVALDALGASGALPVAARARFEAEAWLAEWRARRAAAASL